MSSKTKEKEPITIETTILKINIKTTGDLITKDYDLLPFHPNMADLRDLSNNSYILFPSFVKITMKDLQKAGHIYSDQSHIHCLKQKNDLLKGKTNF